MKFKTFAATAAAVITGTVGSAWVATPASAAIGDCFDYLGTICMSENADWGGRIWRQTPSQIGSCRALGRDFDNKATDLLNNTSGHVVAVFWDNSNCTGTHLSLDSQSGTSLRNQAFNDHISAVEIILL